MTPEQAQHIACIAYFKLSEELRQKCARPSGYDEWLKIWESKSTIRGRGMRSLTEIVSALPMGRRWRIRKRAKELIREEELRRMSDDFGCGPILRYGEDRWGSKDD